MSNDSNESPELLLAFNKLINRLEESMSDRVIDSWIKPLKPISLTEDSLTLSTKKFNRDWIISRYQPLLDDAIRGILGSKARLVILVDNNMDTKSSEVRESIASYNSVNYNDIIKDKIETYSKAMVEEKIPMQTSLDMDSPKKDEVIVMLAPGDRSSLNPRYTFDSFVTGKSNQLAHAASIAVANDPGNAAHNPLFMYGGVGLGKTHLMQAIGNKVLENDGTKRILYISSENFTNEFIRCIQRNKMDLFRQKYRSIDVLLIDDIQFFAGQERTQEEFFHTFNALRDSNKQIILSSDKPAREVKGLEERLSSRFGWGLPADIQPPDFETRIAILKKKATLDNISIPDDVIIYIASHIDTNIRELEGALTRLMTYASIDNRPINSDLVIEALRNIIPDIQSTVISTELIERMVASYFNIKTDDLHSSSRKRDIVFPRQVAMYLCRELTDMSLPEIGKFFGGKDHTTVMHSCEKITDMMVSDNEVKNTIEDITKNIKKI